MKLTTNEKHLLHNFGMWLAKTQNKDLQDYYFDIINEYIDEQEETNQIESRCPKCNKVLSPIDINDYDFECLNCNKRYYSSEVE